MEATGGHGSHESDAQVHAFMNDMEKGDEDYAVDRTLRPKRRWKVDQQTGAQPAGHEQTTASGARALTRMRRMKRSAMPHRVWPALPPEVHSAPSKFAAHDLLDFLRRATFKRFGHSH
jgi:hypothetical protein